MRAPKRIASDLRRALWLCGFLVIVMSGWRVGPLAAQDPPSEGEDPAAEAPAADDAAAGDSSAPQFLELREAPGLGGAMVQIEEPKGARNTVRNNIVPDGTIPTEHEKLFEDYYRFRIAELTWAANRAKLHEKREEFKKDLRFAGKATNKEVHNRLNAMLLAQLPAIAGDDRYHWAVRYNCMLIVADLNEQELRPFAPYGEETPLPAALGVLLDKVADESQDDAVRVAALRGVLRHAARNMGPDARKSAVEATLKLVQAHEPPAGKDRVVHLWMRCQASAVLAAMAMNQNNWPEPHVPQVASALHLMAAEADTELAARCEASRALGALEAKSFPGEKVSDIAHAMASVVVAIAQANAGAASSGDTPPEPAGAKQQNTTNDRTSRTAQPAADANSPAKQPSPPEPPKLAAEELAWDLDCVQFALKGAGANRGLLAAADDATKRFIDDLLKQIEAMLLLSTDTKLDATTLATKLRDKGRELEAWLKDRGQAGPMAAVRNAPAAAGANPPAVEPARAAVDFRQ